MTRARLGLLTAGVGGVVGLAVLLHGESATAPCGLPPEGVSAYRLAWVSSTSVNTPSTRLEGQMDLAATLRLDRKMDANGSSVVRASLHDVSRSRLVALGAEVGSAAQLEGQVAQARLAADGRVESFGFQPETSEVTRNVLQWLLNETQVVCPPNEAVEWTTIEPSMLGDAVTAYARVDASIWSRSRGRYVSVRGLPESLWAAVQSTSKGELRFGAKGELEQLTASDALKVEGTAALSSTLSLTRTREVPEAAVASKPFIARAATEIVVAAETETKLLQSRAAGMTTQQVMVELRAATGGMLPDHNRWLGRASAALGLDPSSARELSALSAEATPEQRALIVDLLASAQTVEARRELVSLLDSAEARKDPAYSMLVQRLAMVTPDDEVARFALERFSESTGADRVGFAYALGAIGRDDTGAAGLDLLREAIDSASTDTERGALLGALANAGDPADVERILAGLQSGSVEVRRGAALAARSAQSPVVTAALVDHVADVDPLVSLACVASLTHRTLAPALMLRIDQLLTANRVHLVVDASLARLLAAQAAPSNRVPLQTLLARAETGSSDLAFFIRDTLGAQP